MGLSVELRSGHPPGAYIEVSTIYLENLCAHYHNHIKQ